MNPASIALNGCYFLNRFSNEFLSLFHLLLESNPNVHNIYYYDIKWVLNIYDYYDIKWVLKILRRLKFPDLASI